MNTIRLNDVQLYLETLKTVNAENFEVIVNKVAAYKLQLYEDIFNVSMRTGEIPAMYLAMQLNYISSQCNRAYRAQQEVKSKEKLYTAFELYIVLIEKIHAQLQNDFPIKAQHKILMSMRAKKEQAIARLKELDCLTSLTTSDAINAIAIVREVLDTAYHSDSSLSVKTANQLQSMLAVLTGMSSHVDQLNMRSFVDAFVNFNINTVRAYTYCKQLLLTDQYTQKPTDVQCRLLRQYKRDLQQYLVTHQPLNPSQPGLKAQLIKFMKYELAGLHELELLATEQSVPDMQYKVSFSVKQLAFYIFLNAEAGIITEQRAKRIHQYIVNHIATEGKEAISEKSFKNAYYLHAPADIKKVEEKLAEMLAIARAHY